MPVTLLRHTTPAVAPGTCYGMTDLDVSDAFEAEAREALEALPDVDHILSSPLRRCARLAEHVAGARGAPLAIDDRLREMDFGRWEGRAWSAIPRAELDLWAADFLHARPHGGESVAMLTARTREALAEHIAAPRHVLVVTHAGVIKAALAAGDNAAAYSATIGFGRHVTLLPNTWRSPA